MAHVLVLRRLLCDGAEKTAIGDLANYRGKPKPERCPQEMEKKLAAKAAAGQSGRASNAAGEKLSGREATSATTTCGPCLLLLCMLVLARWQSSARSIPRLWRICAWTYTCTRLPCSHTSSSKGDEHVVVPTTSLGRPQRAAAVAAEVASAAGTAKLDVLARRAAAQKARKESAAKVCSFWLGLGRV